MLGSAQASGLKLDDLRGSGTRIRVASVDDSRLSIEIDTKGAVVPPLRAHELDGGACNPVSSRRSECNGAEADRGT
jgi:hypothetical protein